MSWTISDLGYLPFAKLDSISAECTVLSLPSATQEGASL